MPKGGNEGEGAIKALLGFTKPDIIEATAAHCPGPGHRRSRHARPGRNEKLIGRFVKKERGRLLEGLEITAKFGPERPRTAVDSTTAYPQGGARSGFGQRNLIFRRNKAVFSPLFDNGL